MGMDLCLNRSPMPSGKFSPNQCSGHGTRWSVPLQNRGILSYFQVIRTSISLHSCPPPHRMWRNWNFLLNCKRKMEEGGGWSAVLSNEHFKMGTAKLKWGETDLPPNMNTRKMQMYQQWIYYSEYVEKQKESRGSENELLPSTPLLTALKKGRGKKWRRIGW